MKIRRRLAGAALLAGLLLLDGFLILRGRAGRGGAAEEAPVFAAPVSRLDIRVPGREPSSIARRGGLWETVSGPPPSPELATRLAEDLATARPERVTADDPGDPAQFGLDPGTAVLVRFSSDAGGRGEILLGRNLPLDVLYVYASVAGRAGVFKVPAAFRDRVVSGR